MRAMPHGHGVSPARSHRHLDAFNGFDHQQAQLAVEHIQAEDLLKRGAWLELVLPGLTVRRWKLVGQAVGAEAVVANVAQVVLGSGRVNHHQTALLHQPNLIGQGDGRLVKAHGGPRKR